MTQKKDDKMKPKFLIVISIALGIIAVLAGLGLLKKDNNGEKSDFNIILISIDTLRADHLGCYNYPHETSPSLDKFREDAILFRRCMAQAPSTLASHASILTSLIPSHHNAFFTRSQALPEEILTLAEILQEKGYYTVSFNDGGQIAPRFGLNQGFDLYESMDSKTKTGQLNFKQIVDSSIHWLKENTAKRFFLFLHTYETHHPYTPEDKYLKLFELDYKGKLPKHISVELIKQINNGEVTLDEEDKKHIINAYDAEIRSMDDSFSKLIKFLKENNLYESTLIIFTSDHGEEFGEHGIWATHSHSLFNDQLHVPLIIKLPNSRFSARKVDYLVRSIDILPTVLDLLGKKEGGRFEGFSLYPYIKGTTPKKVVFAISQRDMQETFVPSHWSIMTRKWKLYNNKLYNLFMDPGQLSDVSSSQSDLKKSLEKKALNFIKQKRTKLNSKRVILDEAARKKLKSLGYLD